MAQYFQIGLSSPMTMEELMAFGGGDGVQYFNINPEQHQNIEFQTHENQVVIDQATGQPVQLGLGFPQVLQHQQVVILTEAVENSGQPIEAGETPPSQLPIVSHEGVSYTYQQQQQQQHQQQQQVLEHQQHLQQLQQQQQLLQHQQLQQQQQQQQLQQMECDTQVRLQTEQQPQQQFINNTEASDAVPMEVGSQELQGVGFSPATLQPQQQQNEQEQQQILQLQLQRQQLQQEGQQLQLQQQQQMQLQQQQQHQIGTNNLMEQAATHKVPLRDWRRQKSVPDMVVAAPPPSPCTPQELSPAPSPQAMVNHMQAVMPVTNMPPPVPQTMVVATNQNQLLLNHMQNKPKPATQMQQVQQFTVPVIQRETFMQSKPTPQFSAQSFQPAGRTVYGTPRRQYDRKRGAGRGRGRGAVLAMNAARIQGQNYNLQMQVNAQTQAILSQHPGEAQSIIQRQQLMQQQRDQQVIIQNHGIPPHALLQNQGNRTMVIQNAQSQLRLTHNPANQHVTVQNHGKQQIRLQYQANHAGTRNQGNQQASLQVQQSPSSIPNQPVIIQRLPQQQQQQHIRNVIVQPQSGGPCNVIRQHQPHANVLQQLQAGMQHGGMIHHQVVHQQEQIAKGPEEHVDSTMADTKDEPPREVIICMSPDSKVEVHNGGGFSLSEILQTLGVKQTETGEYILTNPELFSTSEVEVRIDSETRPDVEVKQEVTTETTAPETQLLNADASTVESRSLNVINEQENVVSSSSNAAAKSPAVPPPVSQTPLLDLACQPVTSPPPPENKEPKFVAGMYALCPYCGYTSVDFNHCQRCRKKIPEDCKQVPMNRSMLTATAIKKEVKEEKTISTEKFYLKMAVKSESPAADPPKPKTKRGGARKKVKIEEPGMSENSSPNVRRTNRKRKCVVDATALTKYLSIESKNSLKNRRRKRGNGATVLPKPVSTSAERNKKSRFRVSKFGTLGFASSKIANCRANNRSGKKS